MFIFLIVLVVAAFWMVGVYNGLIGLRNQAQNAWTQIDVQLKRRHDLIPNLVNTVKGAMDYERGTMEAVIAARAKAMGAQGVKATAEAEGQLTQALGKLVALMENYPDLKASTNVLQLQEELTSTENRIGFARQQYNDSATAYNTRQQQFPASLVAGISGAKPADLWVIADAGERAVPTIDLTLTLPGRVSDANLFAQQAANRRRSFWLVAGFLIFFAWVGFGGDYALYLLTAGAARGAYHHTIPFIGVLTTAAAAALCAYAWQTGPRRVLLAAGAWEIITPSTAEQKQLDNVVEEMAIAAGLPKPTVWVVPDPDLNAFATGHDPRHASLAVTQGLLDALDRDELQAVVAHEMSHIQNDDVKLMTLLAGMLGAVALLSDTMSRSLRYGGRGPSRAGERPRRRQGGRLARRGAAGPVGLHPPHRARGDAAPRDGGEPQAGIPGGCHRRAVHQEPGGAGARAGAARRLGGGDAEHHAGRGASVHRGSGGAEDQRPGGALRGHLRLPPADPSAGGAAEGDGLPGGQAGGRSAARLDGRRRRERAGQSLGVEREAQHPRGARGPGGDAVSVLQHEQLEPPRGRRRELDRQGALRHQHQRHVEAVHRVDQRLRSGHPLRRVPRAADDRLDHPRRALLGHQDERRGPGWPASGRPHRPAGRSSARPARTPPSRPGAVPPPA